ncbi:DNA (cytosine-5-)-methyltransferase [Staphylococcus saprophyticus]|nr:DNA (cytosine-5-)-methyltransferase [Staphylococcus saprophyticus]MDW4349960.1 DNA (cytosine-5-)-methyltransferase [Staphylococcus saprophyticus]
MNFIDICSGIGGFRSALEMNGHNCLAFAEIDKYAKQSYRAIYDTEGEDELDDITAITDEHFRLYRGQCDIITGGFPCQAFSIAGNRRGFDDTRGTIFFHIARAIKEIQPSYVLLENVKGLFSHDKGRTFGTIIQALDELGYVTEWGLFNSKYWGVPQNRERVYILVTRKDKFKGPVLFDLLKQQTEVTTRLIDVLEDEVDEKYYLSEEKMKKLTLDFNLTFDEEPRISIVENTSRTNYYAANIYDPNGLSTTVAARDYMGPKQIAVPVLTPDRLNKRQNGRRFKEDGEPMFTLTSQDRHGIAVREATKQGYAIAEQGDSVNVSYPTSKTRRGRVGKQVAQTLQAGEVNQGVVMNDIRIRKLVPIETWRLQGFTDEQFYKAKDSGVSNSQLYKQAGNSVSVPVVDAIVKCL